ncbi:MAG: LysM domain-containing protein [Acetanaerobacterium sp.]
MGLCAREVVGEGELFGTGAFVQYHRLVTLYRQGGAGLLYLPDQTPFPAYFAMLTAAAQPGCAGLRYTFMFVEQPRCDGEETNTQTSYTVREGETLFDIAARYNTDTGTLLAHNPHITSPNRLSAGQVLVIIPMD